MTLNNPKMWSNALPPLAEFKVQIAHLSPTELWTVKNALKVLHAAVDGQLNSLCRINRLPPEILIMIFHHTFNPVNDDDDPWNSSILDCAELTTMTHVCKHWREIAVGAASLWKHISKSGPSPSLCLERSRLSPLLIHAVDTGLCDLARGLLSSGRPIKVLILYFHAYYDPEPLRGPATYLETLHLSYYVVHGQSQKVPLFDGQTPVLHTLTLWHSSLPANSFDTLTRLAVYDVPGRPELSTILSLFQASPNLEDIILVAIDITLDHRRLPVVHLNHLRTLYLGSVHAMCAAGILSHVSVHINAAINLQTDFGMIIPRSHVSNDISRFAYWHATDKLIIIATGSSSAISMTAHDVKEVTTQDCVDILGELPQAQITELWLQSYFESTREELQGLYSGFSSLTTIVYCIRYEDSYNAVEVLLDHGTSDDIPLCPALTTLRLLILAEGALDVALIRNFTGSRMQMGFPIRKLIIESIKPLPETEEIKGLVEEVECKVVDKLPTMAMPEICMRRREVHGLWDRWLWGWN
ncbi:hypothetical protein OBBRIDRAFT_828497 [Obba rivulosa]|uniref:F-box domain-containing protein n=1 Tax=Obba rivulosa TaxID=1052685 RepID=A0A8E2ASX8_9APHY|nr:hypothetical protein OBBRIDRAFT_828497 [Obba rivulosa]